MTGQMEIIQHRIDSPDFKWFALYTKPRHEKKVERQLLDRGIESYLPLKKVLRRWSDRKKWIEEPLFRSYVFIHADGKERLRALQTAGAMRVLSFDGKPAVVRDEEIETIRRILRENPAVETVPQVSVGDTVEIVRGALLGICGRLEEIRGEKRLVVSIDSIRQSMRFSVDASDVRVLKRAAR